MKTSTQVVKERPILFSGPMVRAILEGRKTQTRRVMKPQPEIVGYTETPTCPFGKPGDRLWVREAFRVETDGDEQFVTFVADGKTRHNPKISEKWTHLQAVVYGDTVNGPYARPSIHMPRFVCRIELEVVSVRVERLQDISEEDAKAEGIEPRVPGNVHTDYRYRAPFKRLWDKINGKKHPWSENPWVWVVEFKTL